MDNSQDYHSLLKQVQESLSVFYDQPAGKALKELLVRTVMQSSYIDAANNSVNSDRHAAFIEGQRTFARQLINFLPRDK